MAPRVLPLVVFLAAAVLGGLGCSTTYFHPTKSSRDYNRDLLHCEAVAKDLMGSRWVVGSQSQVTWTALDWSVEKNRYVDQCLRAEGWTTEEPLASESPPPIATTAPTSFDTAGNPLDPAFRPTTKDDALRCYQFADQFDSRGETQEASTIRKRCAFPAP